MGKWQGAQRAGADDSGFSHWRGKVSSMKFHARIFDKDGNRFIVRGFWYSDDDPEAGLGSQLTCMTESMLFAVVMNAKANDWIEITADECGHGAIARVPYRIIGPQFAHGAVDIMLISGPLFDKEMNEHEGRSVA